MCTRYISPEQRLTLNADGHPLMGRMHKPDPKLPPDQQDKRSVIPLEAHDFDRWLTCTVEEAKEMLKVPAVELFAAGPATGDLGPEEGASLSFES